MSHARRFVISPRAVADMQGIADSIARDNRQRAASFIAEPEAKCRTVAANALDHRLPEAR